MSRFFPLNVSIKPFKCGHTALEQSDDICMVIALKLLFEPPS